MSDISDALRKQLESDAGPHATADQKRAAEKRRAAAAGEGHEAPQERHAPKTETTGGSPRKRAK